MPRPSPCTAGLLLLATSLGAMPMQDVSTRLEGPVQGAGVSWTAGIHSLTAARVELDRVARIYAVPDSPLPQLECRLPEQHPTLKNLAEARVGELRFLLSDALARRMSDILEPEQTQLERYQQCACSAALVRGLSARYSAQGDGDAEAVDTLLTLSRHCERAAARLEAAAGSWETAFQRTVRSPHEPHTLAQGTTSLALEYRYWAFEGEDHEAGGPDFATGVIDLSLAHAVTDRLTLGLRLPFVEALGDARRELRVEGLGDIELGLAWWFADPSSATATRRLQLGGEARIRLASGDRGELLGLGSGLGAEALRLDLKLGYDWSPGCPPDAPDCQAALSWWRPRLFLRGGHVFVFEPDDVDTSLDSGEFSFGLISSGLMGRVESVVDGTSTSVLRRWAPAWWGGLSVHLMEATPDIEGNDRGRARWEGLLGFGVLTARCLDASCPSHLFRIEWTPQLGSSGISSGPRSLRFGYGIGF